MLVTFEVLLTDAPLPPKCYDVTGKGQVRKGAHRVEQQDAKIPRAAVRRRLVRSGGSNTGLLGVLVGALAMVPTVVAKMAFTLWGLLLGPPLALGATLVSAPYGGFVLSFC